MTKRPRTPGGASAELLDRIAGTPEQRPAQDKLDAVAEAARRLRAAEQGVQDAEDVLKRAKQVVYDMRHKELPDLFDAARIRTLGIGADGNDPAVSLALQPYYKASLPDDEGKRGAALEWLLANKHGDIVKTVIVVELGLGEKKLAETVGKTLKKMRVPYSVKLTVPWQTLTAWLKEQVEERNYTPPLGLLGGTVGRVVKSTKVKEN